MTKVIPCRSLAVFGTASDVGKSMVATALCRIFADLGYSVAPFKSQNMSNNSFVTVTEGEIARAQAVQAHAARIEPTVDMNPVLLKPSGDCLAQVILHGKSIGNRRAGGYFADTSALMEASLQSLQRLQKHHDLLVIEGAGSCAEVNLASRDFVNFKMAQAAEANVLLVADIERGGVFAQIIGTLDLLSEEDRAKVKGVIINRFRGNRALFEDGVAFIEKKTGLPVLGVLPFLRDLDLDAEDSLPTRFMLDPHEPPVGNRINIAVIYLPHISNFTDFSALSRESIVDLHYLRKLRSLDGYDLVILPGSKNVRFDLEWLRHSEWDVSLSQYAARGGELAGICGGYQMLGMSITDSPGIEGDPGQSKGLSLLEVETTLERKKSVYRSKGAWLDGDIQVEGYEIHHGKTVSLSSCSNKPVIRTHSRGQTAVDIFDGQQSGSANVWGCYLHGLFDGGEFRKSLLTRLANRKALSASVIEQIGAGQQRPDPYDVLAAHFRENVDIDRIIHLVR